MFAPVCYRKEEAERSDDWVLPLSYKEQPCAGKQLMKQRGRDLFEKKILPCDLACLSDSRSKMLLEVLNTRFET